MSAVRAGRLTGLWQSVESWLAERGALGTPDGSSHIRRTARVVDLVGKTLGKYQIQEEPRPVFRVESETEAVAAERMKKLKAERDNDQVKKHLDHIRAIAKEDGEELIPTIIEAVKVYCTQQEVMDVLKEEYGWRHMKNC